MLFEGNMTDLGIDLEIYPNEAALLAALQRGDADACTCLVKRFAMRVYRPALRILDDADEADAVVQQTFEKACAKLDSFEERSQLGTWLYRIAVNEALMRQRKNGSEVSLEQRAGAGKGGDCLTQPDAAGGDPMARVLNAELGDYLLRALQALPESLRQVVVMRDLQGLSGKETATTLGISESAVKVRLHRAHQQLRSLVGEYLAREAE